MRLHMHLRIHELAANLAQGAVVLRRPCIRRTDAVPQVFLTGRHVDAVPERRRLLLRSCALEARRMALRNIPHQPV